MKPFNVIVLLLAFSVQNLWAQNHFVSGIEIGAATTALPLRTSVICDTVFSFHSVDPWPGGITTDGDYIYCNNNYPYIYRYSLAGVLTDSIPNPAAAYTAYPGGDLDFDGTNLILMAEEVDTLYKLNPLTGAVIARFRVSPCAMGCWGAAYDGMFIWVTDYGAQALYKLDASTGAVVNSFPLSISGLLPVKFLGGELYGINLWAPVNLNKIDTLTGNIISSSAWCLPYPLGFCSINNRLWGVSSWTAAGGLQRIYQFDTLLVTNTLNIFQDNPVQLSPNPFVNEATIKFPHELQSVTFSLYNLLGEKVKTISDVTGESLQINRGNLQSGVYIFEVMEQGNRIGRGKAIIY